MLHVGLLILKIIGFVLLGILCLLLGLILIALLVPVRYRMEGSFHGSPRGTARITWLLHILSVTVSYDKDGELFTSARLFGFQLLKDQADGEVEGTGEDESQDEFADDSGMILQTQDLGGDAGEDIGDVVGENAGDDTGSASYPAGPGDGRTPPADEAPRREGRRSPVMKQIARRFTRFLEKIKFYFHALCDKLKHIKDHYDEVLTFVKDEENQKTMKLILKQVKVLIRHILPRKASGYVAFGFEDPYTTGQVLAAASLFYAWYGQKIDLIPMFEEPVLEGELTLKGRLRLGTMLWCGLRVFFNKNFRRLLKQWQSR